MFCEDSRAEIKAANPEAGFGDIGKLLAAAWKECDAETKAQYQQQNQVRLTAATCRCSVQLLPCCYTGCCPKQLLLCC